MNRPHLVTVKFSDDVSHQCREAGPSEAMGVAIALCIASVVGIGLLTMLLASARGFGS